MYKVQENIQLQVILHSKCIQNMTHSSSQCYKQILKMVQCSLDVEIHYALLIKNKVIYYATYKNPLKVQSRTGFESSSHFF